MSMAVGALENTCKPCSEHHSNVKSVCKKVFKIAAVATAVLLDFADGYTRAMAVSFGSLGLFFAVIIPASGGLVVALVAASAFLLSKKILSDTIAPACYQYANVNPNHSFRWCPFLAGVAVAALSFRGPFAAFC
jgi:hypothetical protein